MLYIKMEMNRKIKLEILKVFNKDRETKLSVNKIFTLIKSNAERITFERTKQVLNNLVKAKKFYRRQRTDSYGDFIEMTYGLIKDYKEEAT
jgi:Ca2+-binding EF-hand superfamily protein